MRRSLALALLLGPLLGASACGTTASNTYTYLFFPTIAYEGAIVSDVPGGGATTEVVLGAPFQVGEEAGAPARVHRVIYSFHTASIPLAAGLQEANLYVPQYAVQGDPYGRLGDLLVDHVDVGSGLDAADYDGGTLQAGFATLATSGQIGTYAVSIMAQVQDDLANGRDTTSYRIRFALEDDGSGTLNLASLADGAGTAGSGVLPYIQLVYTFED